MNIAMRRGSNDRVRRAHQSLIDAGVLRPVSGEAESALWVNCDLANMVEGSFNVALDPLRLTNGEKVYWLKRLVTCYQSPPIQDSNDHSLRYWMTGDDQPIGTVMLELVESDEETVHLFALYTFPSLRRQGVATRTLRAVHAAIVEAGLGGLRLDTYWTWQKSLRFYVDRHMWVSKWERNIELFWHASLPEYRVEALGDHATFSVRRGLGWTPLLEATRQDDRLKIERPRLIFPFIGRRMSILRAYSLRTFAVALALGGWPLVRSERLRPVGWEGLRSGLPEGLAHKVEISEALARANNWEILTPRIPGVAYRELNKIIAGR
jgi:GNAT superfamily N-acetyltransferase